MGGSANLSEIIHFGKERYRSIKEKVHRVEYNGMFLDSCPSHGYYYYGVKESLWNGEFPKDDEKHKNALAALEDWLTFVFENVHYNALTENFYLESNIKPMPDRLRVQYVQEYSKRACFEQIES